MDIHRLLIVGNNGLGCGEWAIDLEEGQRIVLFDVQNPDDRQIVGANLLEVYRREEAFSREIAEQLFRGRTTYNGPPSLPQVRDIDHILDGIIQATTVRVFGTAKGTPWNLFRAISQRPGERGELFILPCGAGNEVQFASRDGNCPFIMRLKLSEHAGHPQCVISDVSDAVARVLSLGAVRPAQFEIEHGSGGTPQDIDPELCEIASVLFQRDDNRRVEENRLGTHFRD